MAKKAETGTVDVLLRMEVFDDVPEGELRKRVEAALFQRARWDRINANSGALWRKASIVITQAIPPAVLDSEKAEVEEALTITLSITDFRAMVREEVNKALGRDNGVIPGVLY